MSTACRLVVPGLGDRTPFADACWARAYGLDRLTFVLPVHHGPIFVGPYVLTGTSFGLHVPYGLDIGANLFDDLVRVPILVVAKEPDRHIGDLLTLFHHLRGVDLAQHHAVDMPVTGVGSTGVIMIKERLLFGLIALSAVLCVTACQEATPFNDAVTPIPIQVVPLETPTDAVNLIDLADLDQTEQISVLRRLADTDSTSSAYEDLFTLSDKEIIRGLLAALDEELELRPRVRRSALYKLVFHLRDGRQLEFDYVCEMCTPSFLRGSQAFWQGQDVVAPDAFNRLISDWLKDAREWEVPF